MYVCIYKCVKVKVTQLCPTLYDSEDYTVRGILQARILEWVACLSLLQGIFTAQGLNPGLSHCRHILYELSHQGSPIYVCMCIYMDKYTHVFEVNYW